MNKNDFKSEEFFSNNLKNLLQKNNMTQNNLVEKLKEYGIDTGQSTISYWLNKNIEKVRIPAFKKIEILCKIFNCQISDLLLDANPPKPHPSFLEVTKKKFPVLGEVAAGKPIFMYEDKDCFVMADAEINADYCLIARGDSMINIGIKNGDLVFIKKQDMVRNEEVAVVAIDEEATLKRFIYDKLNNRVTLKSENPKYADMIYEGEQIEHIHILGKAVFFQSVIH